LSPKMVPQWLKVASPFLVAWFINTGGWPTSPELSAMENVKFWGSCMSALMTFTPSYGPQASRDFLPMDPSHLSPLPADIDALESDDWLAEFHKVWPSEPVVIRNLMQKEPMRFKGMPQALTHEHLVETYNDTKIAAFTHMTKDKSAIELGFKDYIARIKAHPEEKLYARAIPDIHNMILDRIDDKWLVDEVLGSKYTRKMSEAFMDGGKLPMFFVGTNYSFSQAHCDFGTSTFMMIEGQKRWVFYAPDQSPLMFPYGQKRNVAFNAGLDVFFPADERKLFRDNAKGYEVTVNPGDVMFFPSMWWHGVQNIGDLTVGIDLPLVDTVGSWGRNAPFTLATFANPKLAMAVVEAMLTGQSFRDVFFDGYLLDKDEMKKKQAELDAKLNVDVASKVAAAAAAAAAPASTNP